MKTLPTLFGLSVLLGLSTGCTTLERAVGTGGGGTAQVTYQNPENFTDMTRSDSGRGADEGYMRELQQHLERSAASRLPAGSRLNVTITDVDMAGDFEPQRGPDFHDIRVVKQIYAPRITLTYQLLDANGTVVDQGERQLRNQVFDWTVTPITQDDPLRYEKALLDDFLRDILRS